MNLKFETLQIKLRNMLDAEPYTNLNGWHYEFFYEHGLTFQIYLSGNNMVTTTKISLALDEFILSTDQISLRIGKHWIKTSAEAIKKISLSHKNNYSVIKDEIKQLRISDF